MNLRRAHTSSLDVPTWKLKYWCCWCRMLHSSSTFNLWPYWAHSQGQSESAAVWEKDLKRSRSREHGGNHAECQTEGGDAIGLLRQRAQLRTQLTVLACWLRCFALSSTSTAFHTKFRAGQTGIDHSLLDGANAVTTQWIVCGCYRYSNKKNTLFAREASDDQ